MSEPTYTYYERAVEAIARLTTPRTAGQSVSQEHRAAAARLLADLWQVFDRHGVGHFGVDEAIAWLALDALGAVAAPPAAGQPDEEALAHIRDVIDPVTGQLESRAAHPDDPRFNFGLLADLMRALEEHGYTKPTEPSDLQQAMGHTVAATLRLVEAFEGREAER